VVAHTFSKQAKKMCKQMLSARKLMTTLFWERKGVLMVEFMQQYTSITTDVYCETLKEIA
jgi:hypothetical protein